MKRILYLTLILSLACTPLWARGLMMVGGGVAAAVGCTTSNDSAIDNDTGISTASYMLVNTSYPLAWQFTTSGSTTITEYAIVIRDVDATGSVTVALYTNNGSNQVGDLVADTTVTLAQGDISDYPTYETQLFTLSTPKTGINGTYWVRVSMASGTGSYNIPYASHTGGRILSSDPGYYDNYTLGVAVYGCAE